MAVRESEARFLDVLHSKKDQERFTFSHRYWRGGQDEEVAASRRATLIGLSSIYLRNYFLLNGQQALNYRRRASKSKKTVLVDFQNSGFISTK